MRAAISADLALLSLSIHATATKEGAVVFVICAAEHTVST